MSLSLLVVVLSLPILAPALVLVLTPPRPLSKSEKEEEGSFFVLAPRSPAPLASPRPSCLSCSPRIESEIAPTPGGHDGRIDKLTDSVK